MNLSASVRTSLIGAEDWQTISILACSSVNIDLQIKQILDAIIPKTSQFCETVAVDRCVEVEAPVQFCGVTVLFSATDNPCRSQPLIYKGSQNGAQEIEINEAAGTAIIKILPQDTCCFNSKVRELFFTILILDGAGNTQAQAQGAFIISPNAAGALLATQAA